MTKLFVLFAVVLFSSACSNAQDARSSSAPGTKTFVHPGIMHNQSELDFVKAQVASGQEPWKTAWKALQASPKASLSYEPHPLAAINRGSKNTNNVGARDLLVDGGAAYTQAIEWVVTGNKDYAKKAIQILNAYASTVKTITGSDAPLVTGESAIHYCNAAEIIRYTYHEDGGWPIADQEQFKTLLRNVFYPIIKDFKPGNNGNWDAAMIQSMLAMGIFLDDRAMFDRAVNQCLVAQSNGAIRFYFNEFGECQESGRDQSHAQMGLGFLSAACEVAWKQGVDLYGTSNNRFYLGTEYIAKYNLGYDVPYVPYISQAGKNDYETISERSRGKFSSIYEKIYHHYHDIEHMPMPYTWQVIEKNRPEIDITDSHTPWGTLMFAGQPN
jgi:Alginate lyase